MPRPARISLAIHARAGSFSDRWLERARDLGVAHRVVDCHGSRIMDALREHQGLLWHWTHTSWADQLIARHVIRGAEALGLRVFPSTETCWTFDDKLSQKYRLEALGAPLARTECFFSESEALAWLETAPLPLVAKLRRGAGSQNVQLLRDRRSARAYVQRAFRGGHPAYRGPLADAPRLVARARARRDLVGPLLRLPRTLWANWNKARELGVERGYVYFQEFLPGNSHDIRVTVIGDRAFGFTRNVRPGDFRASGSGSIDHDVRRIPEACLRIAFAVARGLESQSTAFDFALDREGKPRILEVSYAYQDLAVHDCPGHWRRDLEFVPGQVWPQDAIFEDLLGSLESASAPSGRWSAAPEGVAGALP